MSTHKQVQAPLLAIFEQSNESGNDEWSDFYGEQDSCIKPTRLRAGIMQPAPTAHATVINLETIKKGRKRA